MDEANYWVAGLWANIIPGPGSSTVGQPPQPPDPTAAAGRLPPAMPNHPYYPLGVSIPDYASNDASMAQLLASLAGMLGSALLAASVAARHINPYLSSSALALVCWFVMCGCLHCFFEGYFILNHRTLASSQTLGAQLWKEYSLSDSRYLTSDFFMLSVESITVLIWGPLCFLCAITTVRPQSAPIRHPLRIIASMAHLYGVLLYYATSLCEMYFTGRSHSRPETLYFWVYYVGFNLPWVVVPALILYDSTMAIVRVFRALEKIDDTLGGYYLKDDNGENFIDENTR